MGVKIIVDSTVDLPEGIRDQVKTVPLSVRFGDRDFLDGVTIKADMFYEMLVTSETLPTSSQPTPAAFEDVFREAVEAGHEVVCITIASKLSGTYQSATIASQEFPGRVFVVDSRSASIGAGILAQHALALAAQGMGGEEILHALMEIRQRVRMYFVVDTLEYLKKGGRLNAAVAVVGGMLNIKPVLTTDESGQLKMLGTARGLKKAYAMVNQELEKNGGVDDALPAMLGCTGGGQENLHKYLEETPDRWGDRIPMAQVGCAIGVHVGPGTTAVCWFSKE